MRALLWAGLLTVVFVMANVIYFAQIGLRDHIKQVDLVVLVGKEVDASGRMDEKLVQRLDRVLELYRKGLTRSVHLSGIGRGNALPTAPVMARYLTDNGLSKGTMVLDFESRTLEDVARHAYQVMQQQGMQNALGVFNFSDVPRAKLTFTQVGVVDFAHIHEGDEGLASIVAVLREIPAYYVRLLAPVESGEPRAVRVSLLQ